MQIYHKITAIQMHCCNFMGKFKIPENPPTVNKIICFPHDIVDDVEKAIKGKDCTFSAFVIAAVREALEDLKSNQA